MARAPIYLEVKDAAGNALSGATVAVTKRTGGALTTLYAAETGPTTMPNPTTSDGRGRVQAYVDRGAYIATVSGTGITTYAVAFDAVPGDDREVDTLWLPGDLIPRVTTLPTTGLIDGMEVNYVADAANGVVWRLKYNAGSGSTYKWEFVGGPPLSSFVETSETTASTTYVALATAGPSITAPLAGEYMIDRGAGAANNGATASYYSLSIGGVAATDADVITSYSAGLIHVARTQKKTVAAGQSIAARYRAAGGTGTWANRWMTVRPVRVI